MTPLEMIMRHVEFQ